MTVTFESIAQAHAYANEAAGGVHMYIEKAGYTHVQAPWLPGKGPRVECFKAPRAAALHALLGTDIDELQNDYAVLTIVDDAGTRFYAAAVGHPAGFTATGTAGFLQFLNNEDWQEDARHMHVDKLKQDT